MNADELQGFLFVLAMAVVFGRSWQLSRAERENRELRDTINQLNDALGKANAGNTTLIKIAEHWKAQAGMKRIHHAKN